MQTINLGRLAFKMQGDHQPTSNYSFNSVVRKGAGSYVWSSQTPGNSTDFTGVGSWKLLVEGYTFAGAYDTYATYAPGVIVFHNGSCWLQVASVSFSAVEPREAVNNQWQKLAAGWHYAPFVENANVEAGQVSTVGGRTYLCLQSSSGYTYAQLADWACIADGMRFTCVWQPNTQYFVGDVFEHVGGELREVTTAFVSSDLLTLDNSRSLLRSVPSAVGGTGTRVLTADGDTYAWAVAKGGNATHITASAALVTGASYLCDTSGGSFTVTLPATPARGEAVKIVDGADFEANPLYIDFGGVPYEGVVDTLALDVSRNLELMYINPTIGWRAI